MSNNNKKKIILCSPRDEYIEGLFKDCVNGDEQACYWFNYCCYQNPCGVKCIYTNSWEIVRLTK